MTQWNNGDYSKVLLYIYDTTITGWGHQKYKLAGNLVSQNGDQGPTADPYILRI